MVYLLIFTAAITASCMGQTKTENPQKIVSLQTDDSTSKRGPVTIVRNIIQDKKGNLWIASWKGVFKYDGKVFTNVTRDVSAARFFSVLEDRNGNLWFGSIGSGVYRYDGQSFKNFTIKDGLLNNGVTCIYEDKAGDIWFGVSGGASRYDGKSFRNYIIDGYTMHEDHSGKVFADRQPYEVNAIMEDKTGKFWIATRGCTFVYNGNTFNIVIPSAKPLKNVRSVIEDQKGRIWLGGQDGLWRYQSNSFANFTTTFVGCIYEDRSGNIWTGSDNDISRQWTLSRYPEKSVSGRGATTPKVMATAKAVFGILEAHDGTMWFSTFKGVHRLDGKKVTYADHEMVDQLPFGFN
jgi:ligand-binding sensor domain-containing protein